MTRFRLAMVASFMLFLGGCTQTGGQIGTFMDVCCPGDYDDYDAYGLRVENMPIFLRDYVVQEFNVAFQEKGLSRNDQINDLQVVLRYNHVNLDPETEDIDPFIRVESINSELSYIAQLQVEMFETATGNKVWGGSISRIHQVTPGEYMHEDRARPEFQQAFRALLAGYPDL